MHPGSSLPPAWYLSAPGAATTWRMAYGRRTGGVCALDRAHRVVVHFVCPFGLHFGQGTRNRHRIWNWRLVFLHLPLGARDHHGRLCLRCSGW